MNTTRSNSTRTHRTKGFTLVELMIAVAIVGILAAVAYPAYLQSIRKSRRADAKTALLDLAARQERYSSVNNVYTNVPSQLGYVATGDAYPVNIVSSGQANYQLSVTVGAPATTYTATATPIGGQSLDGCGTYSISSLGVQSNTGNTVATADCW